MENNKQVENKEIKNGMEWMGMSKSKANGKFGFRSDFRAHISNYLSSMSQQCPRKLDHPFDTEN